MTAGEKRVLVCVLCLATGLVVGFAVGLLIATPVPDCTGLCVHDRWIPDPVDPGAVWLDPAPQRRFADMALCTIGGLVAGSIVPTVLHVRDRRRYVPYVWAEPRDRSR